MKSRQHETRGDTDHGFTLIEMLVVLALLSLAAVIAAPMADGSRKAKALAATAAELASELRSARATAVRSNIAQTLTIDTASRHYLRDGWQASRAFPPHLDIALDTIRGEQSGPNSGRIRFYPDGSATGGRIVLGNGPHTAVVSVDWLTGGTRVSAGD